ncbi:uncharacterized protein LOC142346009 [Convolutriloba macropyga]|uniref:uncharacterized protein LOC142346009 n=1 Tax=Convolutriloba macropyga TaxID=536237 RepID=UPI003F526286
MDREQDIEPKLPECPICKDLLDDPRQLSCGHCFCGPHKKCLYTLLQPDNLLKCALCCVCHRVSIESIAPMYGLREFLSQQRALTTNKKASESREPDGQCLYCSDHPKTKSKYWCKNCETLLCSLCLEEPEHLEHRFILFQANIRTILAERLSKLTGEKNIRTQQLQQKIEKAKLISKSVQIPLKQISEAKHELKRELDVLKSNWAKLENVASGTETNPDLTLVRWLLTAQFQIPNPAETQIEVNELNSLIVERCEQESQTVTPDGILKVDKETETDHNKSAQDCENGSVSSSKFEAGTQVDAGTAESAATIHMNNFGNNHSQTFGNLATNCPPIIRDSLFFEPFYVYLPLDTSLQTKIIIWSQVSTRFCTFRLGIERWRNNNLRAHIETRHSIRHLTISVTIKNLKNGGDFCLWRDFVIDGRINHLWRQTDLDWTKISDSLPGIVQILVEFRMDYSILRNK